MSEDNKIKGIKGNLDLLKYNMACIATVSNPKTGASKRGVFIPFEGNDIYVKNDEATGKAKRATVGLDIIERKEPSQYGHTHYCKQLLSKEFSEMYPEIAESKRSIYMGDFTEYERKIGSSNAAETVEAEPMSVAPEEQDDLPF